MVCEKKKSITPPLLLQKKIQKSTRKGRKAQWYQKKKKVNNSPCFPPKTDPEINQNMVEKAKWYQKKVSSLIWDSPVPDQAMVVSKKKYKSSSLI